MGFMRAIWNNLAVGDVLAFTYFLNMRSRGKPRSTDALLTYVTYPEKCARADIVVVIGYLPRFA